MTRGDQALEHAADTLETFVRESQRQGGLKAKVGEAFAEDPEFLRRLKPSLVKSRVQGKPVAEPAAGAPLPKAPRPPRTQKAKSDGPSPWLVLGLAFAVGLAAAKVLDWRGHAHPRW